MTQQQSKTIRIAGMSCSHCSNRVQKALSALSGVTSASVDLTAGTATVQVAPDVTDEALRAAVEDAGYDVEEMA